MSEAIHTVGQAEIPIIALTLAKAFHDDPVMAIMFGGAVPQAKGTRFFETMATIQMGHGLLFATAGLEAAAIWAPPGAWKVPSTQIARHVPAMLRVMGLRFATALRMLNTLEKAHPTAPHYYLEFIGAVPDQQGRGFGTLLMQPMLERCDNEGVGAYLESSKESNLAFYARFGFEVTKQVTHTGGVPQWLMWRDPR